MNIEAARTQAVTAAVPQKRLWQEVWKHRISYGMMTPYLILFTLFTVVPVIASILLGFTYFNMLEFPRWRGLMNFQRLFLEDDVFLIAIKNTLIFAFITGPISYFLCFIFAWFINELPNRVRPAMTLVFYAPSISGNIFVIWLFIFSGDAYGFINGRLMAWGFLKEPIQWLTNPKYNLSIVVIVMLWTSMGAGFLAFIAGLQNCDKGITEAGQIDGIKNRWQELWYVTLPQMVPQLMFGAILSVASSFAAGKVAMELTGFPSTDYSTHTIVAHIHDYGSVRYEMGYASAIAVVLFATMVITKNIINSLLRKLSSD